VLETYAESAAHKRGDYGMHSDLTFAAACIRALIEERDEYKRAGAKLVKQVLAGVGVEALES
jgi:ferredoxin-thioredoxin reductase catalytic subunit